MLVLNFFLKNNTHYYKMHNCNIKLLTNIFKINNFTETHKEKWVVMWSCSHLKSEIFQNLHFWQKINQFPKIIELTRKDCMVRNISKMAKKYGMMFNFVPKTYLLPQETSLQIHETDKRNNNTKIPKLYIVKPIASSQGKGIYIADNVEEILKRSNQQIVVSHYISNPLLINNFKFDLRIYVAITSIDPMRIYIFEEGIARFATEPYSVSDASITNKFVHLTNFSINKHSSNFYIDSHIPNIGTKWFQSALYEELRLLGHDVELIKIKIEDVIIKSIIAVEDSQFRGYEANVPFKDNCFCLLGYDILIDENLDPWLLEVNLSSSLATESNQDFKIKSELLTSLLNQVGVNNKSSSKELDVNKINRHMFNNSNPYEKSLREYETAKRNRNFELSVINETREEVLRSSRFKLIYPTYNVLQYKNFWSSDRANNAILRNEIMKNLSRL